MKLYVLKVFIGPDGRGGNPLGVFLDASEISNQRRQEIAAELGFSETVFVTDRAQARLRIHTPAVELALAGHPLVGTAWLLAHLGCRVDVLRPPAGEVRTWSEDGRTWISANPLWGPEFELLQLDSPQQVENYPGAGPDQHLQIWAWQDEDAGVARSRVFWQDQPMAQVRSRVFPTALGITEDEATGSAALRLGQILGRGLVINQGVGSEILVRPLAPDLVAVGGRVELVATSDCPD